MSTSSRPPTVVRRSLRFHVLLLCLVASCTPPLGAEVEVREETALPAYAPLIESGRLAYHDTIRRLEAGSRAAPRPRANGSHRAAPNAAAPRAHPEVARQDTGVAPRAGGARAGGASISAEPRPSYYWDDCVMVGLAVSPHCGI